MAHGATWFEIACSDFDRAKRFYEKIFDVTLLDMPVPGQKMAAFPVDADKGEVGGTIVQREESHPSSDGTLAYLHGGPNLQDVLDRVAQAGGQVAMPKTLSQWMITAIWQCSSTPKATSSALPQWPEA